MKNTLRLHTRLVFAIFLTLLFPIFAAAQTDGVAKAIDTSAYDKAIETAELELKQNLKSRRNKKRLAAAFARRGLALVEAAQYRAALGDFRRSLKLNPKNKDARQMYDEIIRIYKSINREPPPEGEEPPPLPFNKSS